MLYPAGTPPRERLAHYVRRFGTVELNASFYRWPRTATFASWRRRLPPGFGLSVKAPRGLTHAKRLYAPEVWVERMRAASSRGADVPLKERTAWSRGQPHGQAQQVGLLCTVVVARWVNSFITPTRLRLAVTASRCSKEWARSASISRAGTPCADRTSASASGGQPRLQGSAQA